MMFRDFLPSLALVLFAAGCDSFYGVSGRVSSCADHRPIPGATVHLSKGAKQGATKAEADGRFQAVLNEQDSDEPSRLTVMKTGFQTVERDVTEPHVEQRLCLPPTTP